MKKQILTNQRNLNNQILKLILCFFLFAINSLNSFGQKKESLTNLNPSILGTWVLPIQASTTSSLVYETESKEPNKVNCYYQYTFMKDGTFKKEVFLYGQAISVSENTEKKSVKGRWFTQNNQIFLTENNGTTSLTYVITKERFTIKTNSNEIELLASR